MQNLKQFERNPREPWRSHLAYPAESASSHVDKRLFGESKPRPKVLLAEDDPANRDSTRQLLESQGFDVVTVESGTEAIERLADGVSLIITDLRMHGMNGMELLAHAREHMPYTPVIMITGHGSEAAAVAALKAGAFHYLTKPINPDELVSLVRQAIEKHQMAMELAVLHQQLQHRPGVLGMIGRTEVMRRLFEKIQMVADTRSTVVIEGESGTGKELVARALHYGSSRRDKPFIAINCAAIPEALIESEMFGHAKGAFTGAVEQRVGKFVAANGGTLLIDEFGEMQVDLQSKLLRAIETRKITPLGSNVEIDSDVRIIGSTHQNLQQLIQTGKFREDLYYRLNVVNIKLPALRERQEDIPLLARAFIQELAAENNRSTRDITAEALVRLQNYDWPGNVRQLRNVLESVIVMSGREVIDVADLPEPIREISSAPTLQSLIATGMPMVDIEREVITQTLKRTRGNRSEASKLLGISTRTLQRRIKEYGMSL